MDITTLIDKVPPTVRPDILDFTDVRLKDGRYAIRVLVDRLLTDEELKMMASKKFIIGFGIATYRYAPEIKKHYFYVV